MSRGLFLLVGALVVSSAVSARAENAILGQMYGSGVHAYFSRDYVKSHEYLSLAIDGGTKDPRSYYFRGLVYSKLGREEEATADFTTGAKLECRDINRSYNVGKSLERVQGKSRLALEQHRIEARMIALKRSDEIRQQRYEEIEQQQDRVLRPSAEAALPEPVDNQPFAKPAAEPAIDPAAEPAIDPAAEPAFEPVTVENPGKVLDALGGSLGEALMGSEEEDGDDDGAAEPAGDMFGPPNGQPADDGPLGDEPAAAEPAAEPADDSPFDDEPAADEPADDSPFGDEPAADEPAADEPAADEPADDNPFGDEPAADEPADDNPFDNEPAADEPADEPVADEPADEPAADEPVDEPADDNPFGDQPADNPFGQ